MSEIARVVRTGNKDMAVLAEALRRGAELGTVIEAVRRTWLRMHEMEDKCAALEKENIRLRERNRLLERDRAALRKSSLQARKRAYEKELSFRRRNDWRLSTHIGAFALGGMAVMIATVAAVLC